MYETGTWHSQTKWQESKWLKKQQHCIHTVMSFNFAQLVGTCLLVDNVPLRNNDEWMTETSLCGLFLCKFYVSSVMTLSVVRPFKHVTRSWTEWKISFKKKIQRNCQRRPQTVLSLVNKSGQRLCTAARWFTAAEKQRRLNITTMWHTNQKTGAFTETCVCILNTV